MTLFQRITQPLVRSFIDPYLQEFFGSQNSPGESWTKGIWGISNHYSSNSTVGEKDNRINPQLLVEVCRSQVVFSTKNSIKTQLTKKPYFFSGGKRSSKLCLDILKEAKFRRFIDVWFEALFGTGGGNALILVNKDKIICEPFCTEGKHRVQLYADNDRREILSYDIINGMGSQIAKYYPEDVYHDRFAEEGDFKFGVNPAIIAARYYLLQKKGFAALQNGFENIIEGKRFVSPDLAFSKDMDNDQMNELMPMWAEFREALSRQPGFMASPIPMKFDNMTLTTEEMQTTETLDYLDVAIGGAYFTALSIVGRSDGVNYANSEQNRDNFNELIVEPTKKRLESLVMDYIMPILLPEYDSGANPFSFGVELNEEELKKRDQSLTTLKEVAPIIQTLGYKIKKESLENLLGKFGLELEAGEAVAPVLDVESKTSVQDDIDESNEQGEQEETPVRSDGFFTRAIKRPKIKGVENLAEYPEILETKKKLFQAIEKQIQEADLSFEEEETTTRKLDNMKPIESYLNLDGWKKMAKQVLKASLSIYSTNYDQSYDLENAPEYLKQFAELFARISLYGWDKVKLDNYATQVVEMVNIPKDYKGVDATTKELLNNKPKDFDQKAFISDRQKTIWEGLEENIFHNAQDAAAREDGKEFVGIITSRDSRVRGPHRDLDNKYFLTGTRRLPMQDFKCRCTAFYAKTEKEMQSMGFTKI